MRFKAHQVNKEIFDEHGIGTKYAGGFVVEGTCTEDNELILVTRHEDDDSDRDWEADYHKMAGCVQSLEINGEISLQILAQAIGQQDKMRNQAKAQLISLLMRALVNDGAISIEEKVDHVAGVERVKVLTHMVPGKMRESFEEMARPKTKPVLDLPFEDDALNNIGKKAANDERAGS